MLQTHELDKFNQALAGKKYDRLPILFNALSDPTRCKIARLLIKKNGHNLSVGNIAHILHVSHSLASQHIKILEITGIAKKHPVGRTKYIEINTSDPVVNALMQAID